MSNRFELVYGFKDHSGNAKKVAKLSGKTDPGNLITDLSIIQYDMIPMFHWTLHNDMSGGKRARYHMQAEHLDAIAEDDRDKFPMLLKQQLPDFTISGIFYNLQYIPIHLKADEVNCIYPIYKSKQLRKNRSRMADFSGLKYDKKTVGYLDLHLSTIRDKNKLLEYKDSLNNVYLWDVYDDVNPNIITVIQFFNFL